MTDSSGQNESNWDSAPSRNLLLAENLELVRRELQNEGVIFGWHYYFGGGRAADLFSFTDYESYYQALLDSRPGDHFTVYSRKRLIGRAIAQLGDPRSRETAVDSSKLDDVKSALSAGKEIVFLRCRASETGHLDCDAGILWESWSLDLGLTGEFLFFLVETLDEDAEGNSIGSVSPGQRRRIHAIVDGKRPDQAGLTPASGPY